MQKILIKLLLHINVYELLKHMSDSSMAMLNHAIAAAMVCGPSRGLELLAALDADGRLAGTEVSDHPGRTSQRRIGRRQTTKDDRLSYQLLSILPFPIRLTNRKGESRCKLICMFISTVNVRLHSGSMSAAWVEKPSSSCTTKARRRPAACLPIGVTKFSTRASGWAARC
ncbi:hypothetical protein SBA3_970013 [Candidatus Sulfopaludibacter sp. SbA3]|nr:hypothetical protein SBA3_970013 [Candidatus Sulfopaludibacter sp. SbA3]